MGFLSLAKQKKDYQGVSLLEALLVLVIMSSIILLSFQQYLSMRRDADIQQLQYNVDQLFQALVKYFRYNCSRSTGLNPSPLTSFYSAKSFPITLNELMTNGYLQLKDNKLIVNPIVDTTGVSQGYILQFNQVQTTMPQGLPQRKVTLSTSPATETSVGSILIWRAQVAVKLKDKTTAEQYKNFLNANCLSKSDTKSGVTIVTPCDSAGLTDNEYVVFDRLPAFASSQYNTQTWIMNPLVKQFTQMYTTYPILLLTNGAETANQYYFCGSS